MYKYFVISFFFALFFVYGAFAQTFNEWRDPRVNTVNRMPMKASYFAYENRDAAQEGVMRKSDRFLSLNGQWKFHWAQSPNHRPTNFFAVGYDDAAWDNMSVPGIWEVNGYFTIEFDKRTGLICRYIVNGEDYLVSIDKLHAGVACVNSWGAIPLPQYRIPYRNYSFTFKMTPVKGQLQ